MESGKTQQDLLNFLRSHNVAVVATIKSGDKVQAATVYFYAEDDLRFYFLTKQKTAKFGNIQQNHSVAMVVSDPSTLQTVQVEGIAKEVDYGKEYASTMQKLNLQVEKSGIHWETLPINHVQNSGYYVLVQITPTWIRWVDYKNWEHSALFEIQFPLTGV